MRPDTVEITVGERGAEEHPSWVRIRANRIQTTGHRLFDSEVTHSTFIRVTVERCDRTRKLNHDWLYNTDLLMELDMSQAQWGAFVSSFGDGGGVPATLSFLTGVGAVPEAPFESRLAHSVAEVKGSAERMVEKIAEAQAKVDEAFERRAGRAEMRDLVADVTRLVAQTPGNMVFAAESLDKHVENVVTKAKADIEAEVMSYAQQTGIDPGTIETTLTIGDGS